MNIFSEIVSQLKTACLLLLSMTFITGVIYPLSITGVAHYFFPEQANGSLIEKSGIVIGSRHIGQSFHAPHYFWGRPSATLPFPYNATHSSGSNLGPSNPDFLTTVAARVVSIERSEPLPLLGAIPVDLVMASASGLDPEMSPLAIFYQVPRVAKARGIPEADLRDLVKAHVVDRTFGLLGEPRVNVLELNLDLDVHHARTAAS